MSSVGELRAKIAEIRAQCTHTWRLRKLFDSRETNVRGICFEEEYTLECSKCEEEKQTKTTEICPCCFSSMQRSYTDERKALEFLHYPNSKYDYDIPVIYECNNQLCRFQAVRFEEDY